MLDLKRDIESKLPFKVPDFSMRMGIWSETEKYRWKEDESVWNQVKGLAKEAYEVYFDGEFVCFFDLSMTMEQVVIEIMQGMSKLFKEEKIYLNPETYRVIAKQKAEEQKIIDDALKTKVRNASTPEEKILGEALLRAKNKRKAARVK